VKDREALVALACLAAGSLLLVVFDHGVTRVLGVLALFAFIATGVFALANPALLDGEEDSGM
jgi:hypothetical protein